MLRRLFRLSLKKRRNTQNNRRRGNVIAQDCAMTRALLDYFATDRASPLCSQNKRDKNSNRNSARVACLMKFVGGDTHTECQGNVIAQTALRLWQPPQMSFRGVKRRGNPLNRNATQWRLPLTALVLSITTAQKIFAIKIRRIRNRTAVSQDCLLGEVRLWRKRINENLFRAFLYTECAYSGCEPQRRREKGAPSIAQTALRLLQPPECHSEEHSDVGIP